MIALSLVNSSLVPRRDQESSDISRKRGKRDARDHASRDTRLASIRRACIVLATHVCELHDDRRTTELPRRSCRGKERSSLTSDPFRLPACANRDRKMTSVPTAIPRARARGSRFTLPEARIPWSLGDPSLDFPSRLSYHL